MYDALRSVKLAAVLIVLIALLATAGGIIPQGENEAFYLQKFPGDLARIILSLGLDKVFTGIPFLLLASLFTVNLTVCTFHRFASQLRQPRENRRHGPDILHIGLLVFIFGGILTARTRTETLIYLGVGQTGQLPEGTKLELVDLKEERYPDGRPKSWESSVVIDEAGEAKTVKVNSPLRHNDYTIYQQDWKSKRRVILTDQAGMKISLEAGARRQMMGGNILFMGVDESQPAEVGAEEYSNLEALFLFENGEGRKVLRVRKGDAIGVFTCLGFEDEAFSGLNIVKDKGYPFVAAGFFLVALGTFLTYLRKIKGMFA